MGSAKDRKSARAGGGKRRRPEAQVLHSELRVAEIVSALSQALDLGSGSTVGHSVRTCILGMRIAAELKLPEVQRSHLYYALLLKDAGWTVHPVEERRQDLIAIRCERGATLARLMGLPEETAEGIAALSERWSGFGNPRGLVREEIPVTSRIVLAAQTLDVFGNAFGRNAALRVLAENSGQWFDPTVVRAVNSLHKRQMLWKGFEGEDLTRIVIQLEPKATSLAESDVSLDAICQAFATIVDAKSPFTYYHSNGVANAAVAIGKRLELESSRILFVRHAALLHDIGKMAIPTDILQKPTRLNTAEWESIHTHPQHTFRILNSIRGFGELSEVAASHHERLNGAGYFRGLSGEQLSLEARILMVADVFDALLAKRPYREGIPLEEVLSILRSKTPEQFDADCVKALEESGIGSDQSFQDLHTLQAQLAAAARAR